MLEKADTRTSGGQMVELHARAKGLSSQTWLMCCVPLQFTISKSTFVGLACFCSVDQHLVLFKYMKNNQNGFSNGGAFLPQLPLRCLEPTRVGQRENKWGSIQNQAAGQPIPSENLAGPLGPPACFPPAPQAEDLSVRMGPDSTSPKRTRHQPPNCQHKSFHNEKLPGKPHKTFTVNSIN